MKSDSIIKIFSQNRPEQTLHHFVFVEAPMDFASAELFLWDKAGWWPARSSVKVLRRSEGPLQFGSRLERQFPWPFKILCESQVTRCIPQKEIELTFFSGFLKGKEQIIFEERLNGTRIDYYMRYQIKGLRDSLLWSFLLRRWHDQFITQIFSLFRDYALKTQKQTGEL